MKTDDLILRISADARPVRRLHSPQLRTALWLGIALPYVAAVVLLMSVRPDLAQKLAEPEFRIELAATFATAVAAAFAAFWAVVPGRSRWPLLLPVVPLAVWLGSIGLGCLRDWLTYGLDGLRLGWDWVCIPAIATVGFVPAVVIVAMLRRGAPMAPGITVALAALAAAGLGNFGLRLFHQQDAGLMVLVWQFGTVAMLTAAAGCAGRRLLPWPPLLRRT